MIRKTYTSVAALCTLFAVGAEAQFTWENCQNLTSSQMKKTMLVSRSASTATAGVTVVDADLNEPVKLAVAKNGDVYIAERPGYIKVWKPDGTMVTAGKLDVFYGGTLPHPTQGSNENGLTGIVFDPNFETNKWVYVFYTPRVGDYMQVARITINNYQIDMASEKVLLKIPIQRQACCHTGGSMQFDLNGNLFITVGNNTTNPGAKAADAYVKESDPNADDQGHSANTNDFRGKILRIKPLPDGTYEVPDGNLFPKGTAQTKPEIWAMGLRNPYSLAVDPYRGWVAWGDVGPDDGLLTEEWNLFTSPGNAGWPYFAGQADYDKYVWRPALGKVPAAPVNNSPNNTGLKNLPPARGATIGYQQSCAVSGPIYHYNGANASTKKLPPHLHKKWLVTDWWKGNLEVVTMSEDGQTVAGRAILMPNNTFNGPLDVKVGPDGALYVIEYGQVSGGLWLDNAGNTAVSKLEYTGTCHPTTPVPVAIFDVEKLRKGAIVSGSVLGFRREVDLPQGVKGFRLYDVQGRMAWEYKATGLESGKVRVPAEVAGAAGAGLLRVKYML
jgi:cytochrome c